MEFRGTVCYGKDGTFDPAAVTADGRSNLERMKDGQAPVGKDGQPVELHHMLQSENFGSIMELPGSVHRKNHRLLHINTADIPSGIDRKNFSVFRTAYWKQRAQNIESSGKSR